MRRAALLFGLSSMLAGRSALSQQMPCMEGMVMPGCTPATASKPAAVPRQPNAAPPPKVAPPREKVAPQGAAGTNSGDYGSMERPTQLLQEPEDPEHRSGTESSGVPDLLTEARGRPKLSLDSFLERADANNPTLRQAAALAERSRQQARQAALYPNPTVGYQGEQIRGGSYGGGEQGGFVQQTIVLGGKLALRKEIARQQQAADTIGIEEQRMRVHGEVSRLFYGALAAQATLEVRGELLGVAVDAGQTAHQLSNLGQADAPDVLQAEVEAEQAKIEYATAQREFIASFQRLDASCGKSDLQLSLLAGSLEAVPHVDVSVEAARILAESPALRRAQTAVQVAEASSRSARRETVPDLTLRAGEQYNGELVSEGSRKTTGAQSFATASIDLPLWNRNQGNAAAAAAEVERAREGVVRTELALKRDVDVAGQAYLASIFEADRYRTELLPRAERAYELYGRKYRVMASAYPQVLVSQRTLFQLRISYLHALRQVWTNALALQSDMLDGALVAPDTMPALEARGTDF